jgi:hypothetical protein
MAPDNEAGILMWSILLTSAVKLRRPLLCLVADPDHKTLAALKLFVGVVNESLGFLDCLHEGEVIFACGAGGHPQRSEPHRNW